jgi:O-succinylhomoserine sulfhydrylase
MNKETLAIRLQGERSKNAEHSAPIYLTSSFVFEDAEDMRAQFAEEKEGHIYSRYANPNVDWKARKQVGPQRLEWQLCLLLWQHCYNKMITL